MSDEAGSLVLDPELPPDPEVDSGLPTDPDDGRRDWSARNGETVLTRQIRYFVAICSFAAATLHFAAMAAHLDHDATLGRAFLLSAILQGLWGVLLIVEPRKIFIAGGVVMTAAFIGVWAASRARGISWFPGLDAVDPLEWRDVTTQFFQLFAVLGALVLLLPASVHKPAAGKPVELLPIAIMALIAMFSLGALYVGTHNYVHGGEGHTHGDEDMGATEDGHTH